MHFHARTLRCAAACVASAATASAATAQNITIADVAPGESMIVIGANNMAQTKNAFDRTGLKNIWDDRDLRDWMSEAMGDMMDQTRKDLDELGVDLDEILVAPSGATGMAMWVNEEKPDQSGAEYVIFADFKGDAEELNENIVEIIMNAVEDDAFTLEETDFGTTTIFSMTRIVDEDEREDEAGGEKEWEEEWNGGEGDDWQNGGQPDWANADASDAGSPIDTDELHYTRTGDHLVICSDMRHAQRAIDIVETGADDAGIGSEPNFRNAMNSVGESDMYTYISLMDEAVMDELNALPQIGAFTGMLETLGLDALNAAAMGVRFDTDDAMAESSFVVDVPEKKGLMALLDNPPMKIDPPDFVRADASSFNAVQFDLARLLPTIERALNELPPEQSGQMGMMFQQIKTMFSPLLSQLGPEIYMVSTIDKPYSATSNKTVTTIRAGDAQQINQSMQQLAPMMGLASRDFLGNTIWSAPAGAAMLPLPAIGVGGGYLTMGDETSVENALRAIDRADADGLGDEPDFRRAVAPLGDGAIAYGFTDMQRAIGYTQWSMNNARDLIEAQVNAAPGMNQIDPEIKEQIIEEQLKATPEFMRNLPSMEVVKDNMGDGAFEVRSTDRGFTGRWLLRRAD